MHTITLNVKHMLGVRDINFCGKYKFIIDIVKHFGWEALMFHPNNFDICLKKLIQLGGVESNWSGRGTKNLFSWGKVQNIN